MTNASIDILLAICVAAVWLGCLGFVRLNSNLDRIHCIAFVNASAGLSLTAATFISDGPSVRAIKVLLITVVSLMVGAAASHAMGAALLDRDSVPDAEAGKAAESGVQ